MTFDPSVYDIPTKETDASLSDDQWVARFVARMTEVARVLGAGESVDLDKYANSVATFTYLPDRRIYTDPEDAADTDISQWESEE
jgi:hypothetical protein